MNGSADADGDNRQQEQDERRREDDALAESLRIAAYADAMYRADRSAWHGRDLTTSGYDLADKQRGVVKPQIDANREYSQRQKERK